MVEVMLDILFKNDFITEKEYIKCLEDLKRQEKKIA